ncbi:MAG: carbonate dehydratase, partial [Nonomuraea sp.]|nr:carbonate dehydratase [Nonomuraea sp.]
VCGHSGCGAMQALLASGAEPGAQTPLARWLRHGWPSLVRMARGAQDPPVGTPGTPGTGGEAALADRPVADDQERLSLVNVMQQLDHLTSHPCVSRRVAEGRLQLQGMYFHVGEAQAYMLDRASGIFAAVRPDPAPPASPAPSGGDGPGTYGLTTKV